MEKTYNGWKNYETWNIALWINNDEGLYNFARSYKNYSELKEALRELGTIETPDKVSYNDSGLDEEALNEMLSEL